MPTRGRLALAWIIVVAVFGFIGTLLVGWSPQLGLDLQGGASVVLQPDRDVPDDILDQSISIIRNRVDALGVAEPDISRLGDTIVVQLPGVRDQDRALEIVGQTAELRFRPVLGSIGPPLPEGATTTVPQVTDTTAPPATGAEGAEGADGSDTTQAPEATGTTETTVEGETARGVEEPAGDATTTTTPPAATTTVPVEGVTPRDQDLPEQEVVLPVVEDGVVVDRLRLGPAALTGSAVAGATALPPQGFGAQWVVEVDFTGEGSDEFNEIAAQCFDRAPTCPTGQLGIVLDGVVQSAPVIQERQFTGEAVISGDFGEEEAKDLALVLRFGALPVQLEPQEIRTVSASLGRDSLEAGIAAGIGGLVLVLLYIIVYYRALGVVVLLGLVVWGALQWTVIAALGEWQGLALTLAGAVGIIVSVGVTVDSYIVYFERLKDEIRSGKTIRSSVDRGFKAAFRTILTADIASLIGATLLWFLTVGSVRGFALFLGISTVLDIVVAWFFTRPMVGILGRSRFFTEARWVGVARGMPRAAQVPSRSAV